jgi:hypothetical protein
VEETLMCGFGNLAEMQFSLVEKAFPHLE